MSYILLPAHQPGPGTELVQHIDWAPGMGGCCKSCDGLGLFDSGMDFTGWSYAEWALVAFGGYVFLSMVNDTRRIASGAAQGAKTLKRKMRPRRKRAVRPMAGESIA